MNIKSNMAVLIGIMTIFLCIGIYVKNKTDNSTKLEPTLDSTPSATKPIAEIIPKVDPKAVATYAEAITASKESKCNIFLYFGAPWCNYCEQMKSKTFVNSAVKEKLSKNFVVLIINTDKDKTTARKFGVQGIPAYMIINNEGNVLREATGYKSDIEFLKWLGDK